MRVKVREKESKGVIKRAREDERVIERVREKEGQSV